MKRNECLLEIFQVNRWKQWKLIDWINFHVPPLEPFPRPLLVVGLSRVGGNMLCCRRVECFSIKMMPQFQSLNMSKFVMVFGCPSCQFSNKFKPSSHQTCLRFHLSTFPLLFQLKPILVTNNRVQNCVHLLRFVVCEFAKFSLLTISATPKLTLIFTQKTD